MPEFRIKLPDFKSPNFRKNRTRIGELLMFFLGLALWLYRNEIIKSMDEAAGHIYGEFIAPLFFGTFGLIWAHLVVKLIMYVSWRDQDKYLEEDFSKAFNSLPQPWQKILFSFCVFALYFLSFVVLATVM
jgi:hypothetical protein